jgi:hypothetical protein
MLQRCYNPKSTGFKHYGARGIGVFLPWHNSRVFIGEIERLIGPRPDILTLDRIDNDWHYEPGNVRWANQDLQLANRRSGIGVELDGEPMTLKTACRERFGLTQGRYLWICKYLREGMAFEAAISCYQIDPSRLKLVSLPTGVRSKSRTAK